MPGRIILKAVTFTMVQGYRPLHSERNKMKNKQILKKLIQQLGVWLIMTTAINLIAAAHFNSLGKLSCALAKDKGKSFKDLPHFPESASFAS